jgi:hypothetical protein
VDILLKAETLCLKTMAQCSRRPGKDFKVEDKSALDGAVCTIRQGEGLR